MEHGAQDFAHTKDVLSRTNGDGGKKASHHASMHEKTRWHSRCLGQAYLNNYKGNEQHRHERQQYDDVFVIPLEQLLALVYV